MAYHRYSVRAPGTFMPVLPRETIAKRIHSIVCNARDIVIDNQQNIFLTRLRVLAHLLQEDLIPPSNRF